MATSDERRLNRNESVDKCRLEVAITRGESTRDQEKHKLKARGEDPEEAAAALSDALDALADADFFDRARQIGDGE